jgi:hypothetical protein
MPGRDKGRQFISTFVEVIQLWDLEVGIHEMLRAREMLRAQTLTPGTTWAVQTKPAVVWSVLLTGGPPAAG